MGGGGGGPFFGPGGGAWAAAARALRGRPVPPLCPPPGPRAPWGGRRAPRNKSGRGQAATGGPREGRTTVVVNYASGNLASGIQ
eukprot:COSAG05_NODE_19634_length_290_cov_0.403141_1_plen_83_part_01